MFAWATGGKRLKAALKLGCIAAVNGGAPPELAMPHIAEFVMRKRLKELGYTTPYNELDEETAKIFALIGANLEDALEKKAKRDRKKKR